MKVERSMQVLLVTFAHAIAKPMLYAVLFVRVFDIWSCQRWEIYSFFSVGKNGEGKCSFCFFVGKSVGQKTKCAFSFAVGLIFCFFGHKGRMYNHIAIIELRNAPI